MKVSPHAARVVRQLVYKTSGIVLDDDKDYLIEARLLSVVRETGLTSIDATAAAAESGDRRVATAIVEALTTNETSFFRDLHPFDAMRQTILPAMAKARARQRRLRIWCGAASTGQEPYSIAMLLRDQTALDAWDVRIVATDINQTVLDRARSGIYKTVEINRGLPASLAARHFTRNGADWQLSEPVRAMVRFHAMNLLETWSCVHEQQDIVFLRNVLIYFDVPTKAAILERIRRVMAPDGVLFLGGAETTLNLHAGYASSRAGQTVYYTLKPAAEVAHVA